MGPCAVESYEQVRQVAEAMKGQASEINAVRLNHVLHRMISLVLD